MATEQFLTDKTLSNLLDYQIRKINQNIEGFFQANEEAGTYHFDVCPKCGTLHPRLIKGGRANSGKPMFRCLECNKRFVVDHGQLTFYSHQDPAKWNDLIVDTINGNSLISTAVKINVSNKTVFRMRHKFLKFLEDEDRPRVLSEQIELDEKYVQKSHKGTHIEGVAPRKRGEPASKRGLSNEKVCIITAIQRFGDAVAQSFNTAKPTSKVCKNFGSHIKEHSFVWTDGLESYTKMLDEKKCNRKIVKDYTEYDAVNHLNNVNSFHSAIEKQYETYRGVASKYINRYNALFCVQRETRGMDNQEFLLYILRKLKKSIHYFFIRQIHKDDLLILDF